MSIVPVHRLRRAYSRSPDLLICGQLDLGAFYYILRILRGHVAIPVKENQKMQVEKDVPLQVPEVIARNIYMCNLYYC